MTAKRWQRLTKLEGRKSHGAPLQVWSASPDGQLLVNHATGETRTLEHQDLEPHGWAPGTPLTQLLVNGRHDKTIIGVDWDVI